MEIKIKNLVNLLIIFSLWEGKKHGYELMNEIQNKTGKRPSTSQIYPFLEKLNKNDLVEIVETGKRGKKIYALTDKGEKFVETKLRMFSNIISATIEKDLTVCAHCGCKVYEGGYKERIKDEKLVFCCKHCANSYKKSF